MDPIVEHLQNAVLALCAERVSEAEQEIDAIDFAQLRRDHRAAYARVWKPGGLAAGFKKRFPGTKRKEPSKAEKRATFARDCYTCRYSHCRRPTVSPDVLRLLSKVFGQVMPYHPHWLDRDKHILYYTYSTNIEHLKPFSEAGPSAASVENLITACYECGDIKNYLTIECLGWHVTEPPNTDWAGLSEHIPRLLAVIAALEYDGLGARKATRRVSGANDEETSTGYKEKPPIN
jgi:5-methylcytosine-specific restriction endonuclease McrA